MNFTGTPEILSPGSQLPIKVPSTGDQKANLGLASRILNARIEREGAGKRQRGGKVRKKPSSIKAERAKGTSGRRDLPAHISKPFRRDRT